MWRGIDTLYEFKAGTQTCWCRGLRPEIAVKQIQSETDIIGLTCMFMHHWPMVRLLASMIRKEFPNTLLVVGGEHVSGLPEYSLRDSEIDVVVIGEGEWTFNNIVAAHDGQSRKNDVVLAQIEGVAYLENDAFVETPRQARQRDLDQIPRPAWHLFRCAPTWTNDLVTDHLMAIPCP